MSSTPNNFLPVNQSQGGSSTAPGAPPKPMMTPPGHMPGMMSYKDGRYTGSVVDAFYGNVQVSVTVSAGKISDLQFLDYPHDRQTSLEINSYATPILKSEALTAQSAKVDVVSGATQTSLAFMKSLDSALSQAN